MPQQFHKKLSVGHTAFWNGSIYVFFFPLANCIIAIGCSTLEDFQDQEQKEKENPECRLIITLTNFLEAARRERYTTWLSSQSPSSSQCRCLHPNTTITHLQSNIPTCILVNRIDTIGSPTWNSGRKCVWRSCSSSTLLLILFNF